MRVVVANTSWVCVVPYWAMWPYETLLIPKRHVLRLEDLQDTEREGKKSCFLLKIMAAGSQYCVIEPKLTCSELLH